MSFCLPVPNVESDHYFLSRCEKNTKNRVFFSVTSWILIESQIAEWEAKEHPKLHTLCIYYILIWSELKYSIEPQLQNCENVEGGKKPQVWCISVIDWVKLIVTVPVQFQPGPGAEQPIWNCC